MNIDYNGFLNEILQLVTSRGNGVVRVIRRSGEPPITIGVHEGAIVNVACGLYRGLPAIPRIREMVRGTLVVQHVQPQTVDSDLPGTDDLVAALSGSGAGESPISATSVDTQAISKTVLLNELPTILSRYIGPMADFVCDDEISPLRAQLAPTQVQELVTLLAENVKDPTKYRNFKEEALHALLGSGR